MAIILLLGSFVLSAILTAVVSKLAARAGFVSQPAADRYHRTIIPLGGGIAIFTTLSIIILAAMAVVKLLIAPGYLDW
ncbi:MAG TPA: hypothetical protein ENH34_05065, partial [Phycisphaerales bacterium]|nr:hypothetical protein [Phycisphaerales bacterium]